MNLDAMSLEDMKRIALDITATGSNRDLTMPEVEDVVEYIDTVVGLTAQFASAVAQTRESVIAKAAREYDDEDGLQAAVKRVTAMCAAVETAAIRSFVDVLIPHRFDDKRTQRVFTDTYDTLHKRFKAERDEAERDEAKG